MTKSQEHEDLVDIVSLAVSDMYHSYGWGVFVEHILAALVIPELKGYRRIADSYIFTKDGYGPILLEVGNMPESKWETTTCKPNNNKVRVLRVGFDKSFYLRNAVSTDQENEFLGHVAGRLSNTACSGLAGTQAKKRTGSKPANR